MSFQVDASKSGGALIGADLGQLICSALTYFWHIPISSSTEASIVGICIWGISHFIPSNPMPPPPPQ
jgi:hypothetical protein